jgi:hypothetical protein
LTKKLNLDLIKALTSLPIYRKFRGMYFRGATETIKPEKLSEK